ncbi:MAG: hypothetical protein AB1538_04030 [Bacillota bacterium]
MWSRPRTSHRSPPVILWGLAGEKIARGALRVPLLRGIPAAAGGEEDHLGGCSRWPAALVTGTGLRITEAGPVRIQAAALAGQLPAVAGDWDHPGKEDNPPLHLPAKPTAFRFPPAPPPQKVHFRKPLTGPGCARLGRGK